MTEQEWMASDSAWAMLEAMKQGEPCAGGSAAQIGRRLRLWVEACRARWPHLDGSSDLSNPTWLRQACERWAATRVHAPAGEIAAILRDVVGNPFRPVGFVRPGDKLKMLTEPTYRLVPAKEGERVAATVARVEGDKMRVQPAFGGSQGVWPLWRPDWITPTVLSLAEAAYAERATTRCVRCDGGKVVPPAREVLALSRAFPYNREQQRPYFPDCPDCNGTSTVEQGTLDPDRLAVLSDALLDAGCEDAEIIGHLRSPGPHVRGCWCVDLLLGRE